MNNLRLPFESDPTGVVRGLVDEEARLAAVDPKRSVALAASAGTGKTRVLVDRYVNLLRADVDPTNILAITFTRKAAAEMRQRIVATLRQAASGGEIPAGRWHDLRDRLGEISISTIDAFCLSLLREFPLEADLDPGFGMADETEVPRLVEEALDHALRACRAIATDDKDVALVFAQLGERRIRAGLGSLLDRRLVAEDSLKRFLARGPRDLHVSEVCRRAAERLRQTLIAVPGGLEHFLADGPVRHPRYAMLVRDIRSLCDGIGRDPAVEPSLFRAVIELVRDHFFTQENTPRKSFPYNREHCDSAEAWKRHREGVILMAPQIGEAITAFRRDLNVVLSRGVWRMFQVALTEYRRTLEAHAVLDFSDVLARALNLLTDMDEFAQSRYRLEARYQHVLVDEFQDTSKAQWSLVRLLVRSWGEGAGLPHEGRLPPSIFIVGDAKQSIYGFRDADVTLFRDATEYIDRLRPGTQAHRSIFQSFRAIPALLSFINDLFTTIEKSADRSDAFLYEETDRFPGADSCGVDATDALGLAVGHELSACVDAVADEVVRLLSGAVVRDRDTGVKRSARPGDIAILFRSRESHREFQDALEARGIPTYVYKGLGFFDADEIKDVLALLRYLADPASDTRAAAFLRSRFIRVSDVALHRLAPRMGSALTGALAPDALSTLEEDRLVLAHARASVSRWLALVDRVPPADLLDQALEESAYAFETRGPRAIQARENLKKMRSLVRRIQNRGYATLGRIAEHLDRLSAGDESNAVIDAIDAVNLMTIHAAKGLEFPIVFVVNLARGTGGRRQPIRVVPGARQGDDVETDGVNGDDVARLSHPSGGQPSVAVGDFQSEADEGARLKEREETKRLLYVAMTRARDRLYFSTVLKDGTLQAGQGSLAEVMPVSFAATLAQAASAAEPVTWRGSDGIAHPFRVCRPEPPITQEASARAPLAEDPVGAAEVDDFAPIADSGSLVRTSVTALLEISRSDEPSSVWRPDSIDEGQTLAGTLVHRLLQRGAGTAGLERPLVVRERLRSLLRAEEIVGVVNPDALIDRAAELYATLRSRADLLALLDRGEALYEVPFSYRPETESHMVLRGSIDCLIHDSDGSVAVIEFKTGTPQPEHQAQLDLYLAAARELFPDAPVRGLLVYP